MTDSATQQVNDACPDESISARLGPQEDEDIWLSHNKWSWQIHLSGKAVDRLGEILDDIEEILKRYFKCATLRRTIRLVIKVKEARLKACNIGGKGCKMVSPWILPSSLTVCRERPAGEDLTLYYSIWDSAEQTWGEANEFNEVQSASGATVAEHSDRLYCVYRGTGTDDNLYWMRYRTDDGWGDSLKFPNHHALRNPSLVDFKGVLYCIYPGPDKKLYICKFNDATETWLSPAVVLSTIETETGVATAVMNNRLHLIHVGMSQKMYCNSTVDCISWSQPVFMDGHTTPHQVALVAYNSYLYCSHRGSDNNVNLWFSSSSDGIHWSSDSKVPNETSWQGPAMAVFDNKIFMVHRASDQSGALYWSDYANGSWRNKPVVFAQGQCTGDNPALASYQDPQATTENYEMPETAGRRLMCVFRGL